MSQLRILTAELGELPTKALERPDAIEDFKARCSDRAVATTNRYLARLRHICNWAIGRELLTQRRSIAAESGCRRRTSAGAIGVSAKAEEQRLLDTCKLLNELPRGNAKLTWDVVQKIRARAQAGVPQRELARSFKIPQSLCSDIVSGQIWDPDAKLTTGDEMRDRIIGALDTGCRLRRDDEDPEQARRLAASLDPNPEGELEDGGGASHSVRAGQSTGGGVAPTRISRSEAYMFGHAKTGEYVGSFRSAWETLLLLSHGIEPAARSRGQRRLERDALRKINLHWHDLRHEALSRLADDGVPVHELQMLAGHASITTTQRYMNARANSLAESMRHARERREERLAHRPAEEQMQVG